MKKILITGGSGFLGLHLANRLFDAGHKIDLVDNFSRGKKDQELEEFISHEGVRIFNLDLRDKSVLSELDQDYDYIYHLAAIVGVKNVLEAPYRVLSENISMLDNLLGFADSQKGLERFVFASTSEVYAGSLPFSFMEVPTAEDTPLTLPDLKHNRTSYMLSKICGEVMCNYANVPTTIVRPHNVYGPRMGMAHVIPELLKKAQALSDGSSLEVFSVDHLRTFCFVDDAVSLLIELSQSDKTVGEVYNLGNQSPEVKIGELAEIIIKTVGKNLEISPQPPTPGSPEKRAPEMSKVGSVIDFRSQVSLEEGVKKTYDWYLEKVFNA